MAKYNVTINLENADILSGASSLSTGEWFSQRCKYLSLSYVEFRRRLMLRGYKCSQTYINQIAINDSLPPIEQIEMFLSCLEYDRYESEYLKQVITFALLQQRNMPNVAEYLEQLSNKIFVAKKAYAIAIC